MAMNPRLRRGRTPAPRGWTAPRPSSSTNPRRKRPRSTGATSPPEPTSPVDDLRPSSSTLEAILEDFTQSWERGERPKVERYLDLVAFEDSAELIYHEFCLAEAESFEPDPEAYLSRFPEHAKSLSRLFALHGVFSNSELRGWTSSTAELPSIGDEIGPYRLLRELGRGSFARVFLAEQTDLDHRLVVLKVSTRATAEPRLLARASHAHIVEVLRHAVAEDGALHLVCMPFLGGATLADVFDEHRRRGRRPRSGADFLADLDRVSAPEYPSTELARPAREILSRLSHSQALAWIVARLAEALDHAHQRGVDHGDLKPSNVLLTAGASPLLLDFNLSIDWRDVEPGDTAELGGTLGYMAPERLEAIAQGGRERPRKAAELHRADLYALGLLLLEALTGQGPEVFRRKAKTPRELASDLAGLRRELPAALRSGGSHSISPALRSILSRCLAPDPLDRYARGNELAEDLDRWRSDRPLAYAEEPRTSGLTRKIRRRRAHLIVFGLTILASVLVSWVAWIALQGTVRDQALAKYSAIIDRANHEIFGMRTGGQWHPEVLGEPIELASRHLQHYGVLNDTRWCERDDIRSLPDRERGEVEAWLFEQILRYAVALGDIPDSPDSWVRGLAILDRTLDRVQSVPLQAQRLVLLDRLKRPDRGPDRSDLPRLPRWMDEYLAGVADEPLQAREALGHYLEALKHRPGFFWAQYRAAITACRVKEYGEAARQLRACSQRCPSNPILRAQLASALYLEAQDSPLWRTMTRSDPFGEAIQESDQALRLDPDYATAYQTRAQILNAAGQSESVEADLERFIGLSRVNNLTRVANLRWTLMFPGSVTFSSQLRKKTRREINSINGSSPIQTTSNSGRFRPPCSRSMAGLARPSSSMTRSSKSIPAGSAPASSEPCNLPRSTGPGRSRNTRP